MACQECGAVLTLFPNTYIFRRRESLKLFYCQSQPFPFFWVGPFVSLQSRLSQYQQPGEWCSPHIFFFDVNLLFIQKAFCMDNNVDFQMQENLYDQRLVICPFLLNTNSIISLCLQPPYSLTTSLLILLLVFVYDPLFPHYPTTNPIISLCL